MPKVKVGDQQVEGRLVDFKIVSENWNEYSLPDGTRVRIRMVVSDIYQTDEKTESGDPVVIVKSASLVQVREPQND